MRPGIRKRGTAYEAWVYDKRTKTKIRKTFQSHAEARAWRDEAKGAVRKGALRVGTRRTVREAWDEWLAGAKDGSIRTRGGKPFKPSAIRSYSTSIELRVLDDFGTARLSDVSRVDLQDAAERMLGEGSDPSTIPNALMPLRAIYRRALARGEVAVNPTSGLELPTGRAPGPNCHPRGGGVARRGGARARPRPLGRGALQRPSPRRTDGASLGRRRARLR